MARPRPEDLSMCTLVATEDPVLDKIEQAEAAAVALVNDMFIESLSAASIEVGHLTLTLEHQAKVYPFMYKLFVDAATKAAIDSEFASVEVRDEFQFPEKRTCIGDVSDFFRKWQENFMFSYGIENIYGIDYEAWVVTTKLMNEAIASSEVLWQRGSRAVFGLGPDLVMKVSYKFNVNHLETMKLIKKQAPSFPIPEIHACYKQTGSLRMFVFMSRFRGEPLDEVWETLDSSQRDSIHGQFISNMQDLISLPHPQYDKCHAVLCGGDPCCCPGARGSELYYVPFFAANDYDRAVANAYLQTKQQLATSYADLDPRKVMVDFSSSEVFITAILDCAMYRLLGEYWNYVEILSKRFPEADCGDFRRFLQQETDGPEDGADGHTVAGIAGRGNE